MSLVTYNRQLKLWFTCSYMQTFKSESILLYSYIVCLCISLCSDTHICKFVTIHVSENMIHMGTRGYVNIYLCIYAQSVCKSNQGPMELYMCVLRCASAKAKTYSNVLSANADAYIWTMSLCFK